MSPYLLALTFFKFNMAALKKGKEEEKLPPHPHPRKEKFNLLRARLGKNTSKLREILKRAVVSFNNLLLRRHSTTPSPWLTFFAFTHSRSSQMKGCSLHGQSSCTSQVLLNTRWHWEKEDCGLDKGKAIQCYLNWCSHQLLSTVAMAHITSLISDCHLKFSGVRSFDFMHDTTTSKRTDGKLLLLEISKSRNCSSVGCLKCVQFHNWFRNH